MARRIAIIGASGNGKSTLGRALADRLSVPYVELDYPLPLILWRLLRRTLRRIRHQEELWNGNRETLRNAFVGRESLFAWTIRSHRRFRRENPQGQKVVRLRSVSEVDRWLAE